MQNAWCLQREASGSLSLLQLRREIVVHNLKGFGTEPRPRGPRQSRIGEARFEGRNRWPMLLSSISQ